MSKKVRKYTKEFKQEAATLALKSPSISKTATELGVPAATMHYWINQLKDNPIRKKENNVDIPDIAALIEENRRLHKELSIAKEEKEILKKAAAYFARESL